MKIILGNFKIYLLLILFLYCEAISSSLLKDDEYKSILNKSNPQIPVFTKSQEVVEEDSRDKSELEIMLAKSQHDLEEKWRDVLLCSPETEDFLTIKGKILRFLGGCRLCKMYNFMLQSAPVDDETIESSVDALFFKNIKSLQIYLECAEPNFQLLAHIYFYFYSEASRYYLKHSKLEKAEENLLLAGTICPRLIRQTLMLSLYSTLQTESTMISLQKRVLKPEEFLELYSRIIIKCCKKLSLIDYIHLTVLAEKLGLYKNLVEYASLALKEPWPTKFSQELAIHLEGGKGLLVTKISDAAYHMRDYELHLRCLQLKKQFNPEDLLRKLVLETEQDKCSFSSESLICVDLDSTEGLGIDAKGRELIALLKMFKLSKDSGFRSVVRLFINQFSYKAPKELQELFGTIIKNFNESAHEAAKQNIQRSKKIIRQAIVAEHRQAAEEVFKGYEQLYQIAWIEASKQVEGLQKLDELDKRSYVIEEVFKRAIMLIEEPNSDKNILNIHKVRSLLENLVAQFSMEIKKIKGELQALRKRKQNQASSSHEVPAFLGPNYRHENLKSTYRNDTGESQELPSESSNSSQIESKFETHPSSSSSSSSMQVESQKNSQDKGKDLVSEESDKPSNASSQTVAIKSFKNRNVAHQIWEQRNDLAFPGALEIMQALNESLSIYNLRQKLNPGTKLEILKGERKGQISLRVNDQWRLCFAWETGVGAHDLEIVDYH